MESAIQNIRICQLLIEEFNIYNFSLFKNDFGIIEISVFKENEISNKELSATLLSLEKALNNLSEELKFVFRLHSPKAYLNVK